MKNHPNLILAVLLLLVIACNCPGDKTIGENTTAPPNTRSAPTIPNSTVATTPIPLKSTSAKSASVITENAYLRQTPNGKIVQTLPVASSVEVIRQKGAWFYVGYGEAKGWMHGNSIRYDSPTETSSVPTRESKSSTYNDDKPKTVEKSNPSGATARCRDGTLSYSRNRRGTCSWHGGVAVWF